MEAWQLYEILEKDFITGEMKDEWAEEMESIYDFICDNFKKRSMGLVCDFTEEIKKVYTSVFPSKEVMEKILDDDVVNAMLFVHHPCIWDIRSSPDVFYPMDKNLLYKFKERKISIYNLHVPLDNYGEHSTSCTLARNLGIVVEKPFAPYYGAFAGVFGTTNLSNVMDMKTKFQQLIGHKACLYDYGLPEIKNNKVAIVAGGGNEVDVLQEVLKEGANTFITGITAKSDYSKKAHDFAKKNAINILGGTHYSTEKFACISMVDYFKKLGLICEFIGEKSLLDDL